MLPTLAIDPPFPHSQAGQLALKALLQKRSILAALEAIHAEMGDVFRIPLPGFSPVVLVGPEANRFVTVTGRDDLRWRSEGDPVTRLLRQGVLVTDGELHDDLRRQMSPPLHKGMLAGYVSSIVRRTDQVCSGWGDRPIDMLVEMRKAALLILMDTLYGVNFGPDMARLWPAILRTLAYISPGIWILWPSIPRLGYQKALARMDAYLYQLISSRRANPEPQRDLLGMLVGTPGMDDGMIRDQLLTLLIAGHDTSTALLAWSLYLLGSHPEVMYRARVEVDSILGNEPPGPENIKQLHYLDQVISETLRLYPPIHIGNRIAAVDLEFQGFRIPAGSRVVYSIYLTHRQERYWPDPGRFDPERFSSAAALKRPYYTYIPFGGGPRNCIGLAFAQVEVKVVLSRILQKYNLELLHSRVYPHMGATLEPSPGVKMLTRRRN